MEKIISACGLICSDCLAYRATQQDDDNLRKQTAELWSNIYGANILSKDINCNGCMTDGVKFSHCNECDMRECAIAEDVENCGQCRDYPCQTISDFFENVPDAKLVLDKIKED